MLDWIIKKWDKNKGNLEKAIRQDKEINCCDYIHLVELVVCHILNDSCEIEENEWHKECYYREWRGNVKRIYEIDDGYYQGTKIFIIPRVTYQPDVSDYLFTHQYYGSCSGCDTLQAIQNESMFNPEVPTESQVKDYLLLCQHLVCNMNWLCEKEEGKFAWELYQKN